MNLSIAVILFLFTAAVIAVAGTKLTRTADQLADLTGLGEALFGALFLGAVTSLSGIMTSVVAAFNDHPELAVSNAIGGIAAQTVFLSIADITYSRGNLEHAAASFANLMYGVLLIGLLSVVLVGFSGPDLTVFHVHPLSILIVLGYLAGSALISSAREKPMWQPRMTFETVKDIPDQSNIRELSLSRVVLKFAVLALIVVVAGYAVAKSGIVIAVETGLSESLVGTLFTAVATSLPELIVSIAAVRRNALTLAVGNIIGGNTFDVLFVAFSDMAYSRGSIFHAITQKQVFIAGLTMLMVSALILGLLHREQKGIGKIGWESFLIILLYIFGNAFLLFG